MYIQLLFLPPKVGPQQVLRKKLDARIQENETLDRRWERRRDGHSEGERERGVPVQRTIWAAADKP